MDSRALLAANKLRIGLAVGILYVIALAAVKLHAKSGPAWEAALVILFVAMVVFLLSAVVRIVHFVYDEW